jgi:hypothetical protein
MEERPGDATQSIWMCCITAISLAVRNNFIDLAMTVSLMSGGGRRKKLERKINPFRLTADKYVQLDTSCFSP